MRPGSVSLDYHWYLRFRRFRYLRPFSSAPPRSAPHKSLRLHYRRCRRQYRRLRHRRYHRRNSKEKKVHSVNKRYNPYFFLKEISFRKYLHIYRPNQACYRYLPHRRYRRQNSKEKKGTFRIYLLSKLDTIE